uniref:Uncharacterized protein n=1 Tax=viral metagenome TaxID=1070528 RepID=A0A6M3JJ29_9ZZZZ
MSTRDEIAARIRAAETPEEMATVIGAALDERDDEIAGLRAALKSIAHGAEYADLRWVVRDARAALDPKEMKPWPEGEG